MVGKVDLALAAVRASTAMTRHIAMLKPMLGQRLLAELVGNDSADPIDQVRQIIAEIELVRVISAAMSARAV